MSGNRRGEGQREEEAKRGRNRGDGKTGDGEQRIINEGKTI